MNKVLLDNIYEQLKSVVSNSFFLMLPNEELLKETTVVYDLELSHTEYTFDLSDPSKTYQLTIRINAPSTNLISDKSIYVQQMVKKLTTLNSKIKYVGLIDENLTYNSELDIYTETQRYSIEYA
jgi:hypothetical protein